MRRGDGDATARQGSNERNDVEPTSRRCFFVCVNSIRETSVCFVRTRWHYVVLRPGQAMYMAANEPARLPLARVRGEAMATSAE